MGIREVTGGRPQSEQSEKSDGKQTRPGVALQRRRIEAGHTSHTGDGLLMLERSVPEGMGQG